MTVSGLSLTGADAGNYILTQPTTTANITAATLTVTGITASNKVYDGNTDATLDTTGAALVGVVDGRRRDARRQRCHAAPSTPRTSARARR